MTELLDCDVAIVGAGPAGMAAALVLAQRSLKVVVLDEQAQAGGQILRQPPRSFRIGDWLPGQAYRESKQLLAAAEAESRINWMLGTTIWGLFSVGAGAASPAPRFELMYVRGSAAGRLRTRSVLIAGGCYEMPVPLPGWTLPGVMGAGAIQTLLKSQQLVAGGRIILSGSHPLQLVVADQLLMAGAEIKAVLFSQSWRRALRLLLHPVIAIRARAALLEMMRILLRLRRRGVRLRFSSAVIAAEGADRLESVRIAQVDGKQRVSGTVECLPCDVLGLCHGFLPSSELARQAGARSHWSETGGWIVDTDFAGRSSIPGLYVAGEVTGVKGADAARLEGELAAWSLLQDNRLAGESAEAAGGASLRRRFRRLRAFAAVLGDMARTSDTLLGGLMTPDTLICRCEGISRGDLDRALEATPFIGTASSLKLFTRVGMGLCQGRYCESSVRRLLRQRGVAEACIGGYTIRPPVKPVPVAALLAEAGAASIDPAVLEARQPAPSA